MTPNRKRKLEDADNGIDVRLSSPKKSKRRVSLVGGDPLAPSLKEWNKMRPFQSFLGAPLVQLPLTFAYVAPQLQTNTAKDIDSQ